MTFSRMQVLICLDLSKGSKAVLDAGCRLAKAMGAGVTLLHVAAPEPDFVGYDVGPQSVRDAQSQELRNEHRELEAWRNEALKRGVAARALMVQGVTADRILEHAVRLRAEVIVLGSHARPALIDALIGSTTQTVLRRATAPVLVVPPSARAS